MRSRTALFVALLIGFQALVLVGMAAAEELGLRRGTEVTLQTVPVDPRDLLRGDYVTLAYDITTPRSPHGRLDIGDTVYVVLRKSGDVWVDSQVTSYRPSGGTVIRGTVVRTDPLRIEYGIEAYFVPEGRGWELGPSDDIDAVVSIGTDGRARLKHLIVNGTRWDG